MRLTAEELNDKSGKICLTFMPQLEESEDYKPILKTR